MNATCAHLMRFVTLFGLGIVAIATARANDGNYSLDSGQLTPLEADHIAMAEEDLRVAFSGIEVDYRFSNLDAREKSVTMGFPLPHASQVAKIEGDGPGPVGVVRMLASFRTRVNGQVKPFEGLDIVAVGFTLPDPGGTWYDQQKTYFDLTRAVESIGVDPRQPGFEAGIAEALEDETKLQELVKAAPAAASHNWRPNFIEYRSVPFWTQKFPPDAEITVSHAYRPVPGDALFQQYGIRDASGRPVPLTAGIEENHLEQLASMADNMRRRLRLAYGEDREIGCVGDSKDAASGMIVSWRLAQLRAPSASDAETEETSRTMRTEELTYVLQTARSWTGPIGKFRLTVDGEGQPVLFCFPGKIETIDPKRFIYRVNLVDFEPKADLIVYRAK